MATTAVIPNRPVFRAQEVCELAEVQPYVLRTWEAEFPDLGQPRTPNGPRVYRRVDVERVLRIKHLLFVDGLTLAGARRRLIEEGALTPAEPVEDADVAALVDEETRQHLRDVKRGLNWILGVLSGHGVSPEDFVLTASPGSARSTGKAASAPASRAHAKVKPAARAASKSAPKKSARGKRR